MRPTERRFLSSTLAAYGSQIGRALVRAASEMVLARLILPQGHGIFDYALAIVVVAGIFRDLGLPYQLVRDERQPYGTVLVWVLGSGAAITALLAAFAPLGAGLDPGLPPVLRVFSLYVLLDGFSVVPKLFFERRLEVRRLVGPEILRGLAIAAVAITLALSGAGVWSLVAGELAGAALYAVVLWRRAWGHLPLAVDLKQIPGLIGRSAYLFLIVLAALPMPYVARFILGDTAGIFWVAQYTKARAWGFRLQELVLPAVARVLYPALVEYRNDRPRFLGAYRLGTVTILALETLAAYVLFFNPGLVLRLLLGENWGPAAPLLRILCLVPLTDPFSRLGGEVLKVEGQDRGWFAVVGLNFVSLVLFGIVLTRALGPPGMAWANYLLLGNLLMAWRIWRICGPEFWRLARDLAFVYLVPLPLHFAAAWAFPPGSGARLAASLAASAVAGLVLVARFHAPFRAFFAHVPEAPPPAAAEAGAP